MDEAQQSSRMNEFLNREFSWTFSAGECNFILHLLAYIVQSNPDFVPDDQGEKEPLNYQSIRSIVLFNEKLSRQLQNRAAEASVALGEMQVGSDRVQ